MDLTEHVEPLLDRYRTGELSNSERARVASHLDSCDACAAALAELVAFSGTVERGFAASRELADAEPDWAMLRQRIVARTSAPRSRRGWLAAHVPQVAAAAVALLAIGVVLQQGIRGPDDVERALEPAKRESSVARSRNAEVTRPDAAAEAEGLANRADRSLDALEANARADDDALGGEKGAFEDEEFRARAAERPGAEAPAAVGQARGEAATEPEPVMEAEADIAVQEEAPADVAEDRRLREADAQAANAAADEAQDKAAVAKQRAAAPDGGYALSSLERFEMKADDALAEGDTLSLRSALSFYEDSLDSGRALDPEARAAARAIADSLAARLAAQP